MNIQNHLQELQRVLGLSSAEKTQSVRIRNTTTENPNNTALAADQTTMSAASMRASEAASLPEIRMDKVGSIQAALANGSYHVDSTLVAAKLVSHMLGE